MTSIRSSCRQYLKDCLNYFEVEAKAPSSPSLSISDRLQIFSYFSVIIPLIVGVIFIATSLCGRVTKPQKLTAKEQTVQEKANQILGINPYTSSPPNLSSLNEFSTLPLIEQFKLVLGTYNSCFQPKANIENLLAYAQSEDCQRHAKTARIYYNESQLAPEDALRTIFQREPTNITMGEGQYNKDALNKLFGYEQGVFNTPGTIKSDKSLFRDLPNTAAVYSETYMWAPNSKDPKEIACLSLPAPALDTPDQPHYNYYVQNDGLNKERYDQEMVFLFNLIERTVRDNQKSAFGGTGFKRIVLCRFGQLAFLKSLSSADRRIANASFREQLKLFLERIKDTGLPVVMSEYLQPNDDNVWHEEMIIGDIVRTAQPGDMIINAWDPHSAPGNGNDADGSFDGAMGRGSGVMLTQTSWMNSILRTQECLVSV